jgi:hypothetical protein
MLTTAQTIDEYQTVNPYHATAVRTDLTRAIPSLLPDLYDEVVGTASEKLNAEDGSGVYFILSFPLACVSLPYAESVTIPVFETTVNMIGRISNRVLVGAPLCRNPGYIRAMVRYAETVSLYSRVLKWFPTWSRE